MLFPIFADVNRQKIKSNAAMVFTTKVKVEIVVFWYENKIVIEL